ncbi:hypothetical protein NQ315_005433 [Exocentrus adspersus]|uniref:C2H2-type domain-containing protein n=1 Tax=Exocentrus adspersus TaxID=1586481 RepID=A0AAV8V6K0_9CUCU|nr:hypothetical protein NQ315_005433 [Exocentrus adspersus]
MNRCTECHIHFSKTSNLTAHMKRKHPDMLHVLAPHKNDKQSQSTVPCLECSKKIASLGNLRLHVKKQHPDKLEEIAPIKKKSHICPFCSLYKKKGINIRKLKTQGTNKIGGYCPARMNTKIMEDKTCVVNFCRSHIGHKQEGRGDGDNLMLIESDDEKMALINAVTETGLETESSLEEAKKKNIFAANRAV